MRVLAVVVLKLGLVDLDVRLRVRPRHRGRSLLSFVLAVQVLAAGGGAAA